MRGLQIRSARVPQVQAKSSALSFGEGPEGPGDEKTAYAGNDGPSGADDEGV